MRTAIDLIDAVVEGRKPLHLICSSTGFAKSSITFQRCKAHGIVKFEPDVKTGRAAFSASPTHPCQCPGACPVGMRATECCAFAHGRSGSRGSARYLKTAFGMQRECILETPEIKRNERYRQAGSNKYDPVDPAGPIFDR